VTVLAVCHSFPAMHREGGYSTPYVPTSSTEYRMIISTSYRIAITPPLLSSPVRPSSQLYRGRRAGTRGIPQNSKVAAQRPKPPDYSCLMRALRALEALEAA
jgi:hypothetical protein